MVPKSSRMTLVDILTGSTTCGFGGSPPLWTESSPCVGPTTTIPPGVSRLHRRWRISLRPSWTLKTNAWAESSEAAKG